MNLGFGSAAYAYDWNWSDGIPFNVGGGDNSNGVDHVRSLANTGLILRNMLTTTCTIGAATRVGTVVPSTCRSPGHRLGSRTRVS